MSNEYDVGDRIDIYSSTAFQDNSGNVFDPDTVTFEVKDPNRTTTTYIYDQDGSQDASITKNGTGDYTLTIDVDTAGLWHYYIKGEQDSGQNRGADQGFFNVGHKKT